MVMLWWLVIWSKKGILDKDVKMGVVFYVGVQHCLATLP
jgi:hypothetical protein